VDHRLAGKRSVTLDDFADEPLIRAQDPAWNAFWRVDPRPDGSRAPDGPVAEDTEDKLELVASGQAVALSPDIRGRSLRPDLVTVPLHGVEPSHVVLATRADDRGGLVAAFGACARAHLTGPAPAGPTGPTARAGGPAAGGAGGGSHRTAREHTDPGRAHTDTGTAPAGPSTRHTARDAETHLSG
jgi:LysR substrate binding domain